MKLYVIGIDGATYKVIRPLAEAGKLPNIARMIHAGGSGRLFSTVPPLSPVAWTTITTGARPAVHGIIDFLAYDKAAQRDFLFDSSHRRVDPVWTLAGKAGKRSCVVNVPLTYPVDPLNGFMISGLGTPPANEGLAYPLEEFKEMKRAIGGYDIDIDLRENQQHDKTPDSLRRVMAGRHKCFDFLLNREPWDLFFFVFTNTDRAQHFFWREHEEGDGPLADIISECYQGADHAVGKVMAKAEAEGGMVMIVSDHGFGPLNNSFSLSNWLHGKGLLMPGGKVVRESPLAGIMSRHLPVRWKKWLIRTVLKGRWKFRGPSAELNKWIDWKKTKFYSHKKIDTAYLFTNDAAFADAAQRAAIIETLRHDLLAARTPVTNEPVVLDVLDGHQVFGTGNKAAPDLVLIPAEGCSFSFDSRELALDNPFASISRPWSGIHESEGVFMIWGSHIKAGQDCGCLSIMDVLPTMCCIMDMPIPWWAEGGVIKQAFDEDFLRDYEEKRDDFPGAGIQSDGCSDAMNEAESEEVAKRLKALGYL